MAKAQYKSSVADWNDILQYMELQWGGVNYYEELTIIDILQYMEFLRNEEELTSVQVGLQLLWWIQKDQFGRVKMGTHLGWFGFGWDVLRGCHTRFGCWGVKVIC